METVSWGHYLRILARRWWFIALSLAVCLGVAAALTYLATPTYQATAAVVRQNSSMDEVLFGTRVFDLTDVQRDLDTSASLIELATVAERVKTKLGSALSVEDLQKAVSVRPSAQTDLIFITARSSDPNQAADIANAFATEFIAYRAETDRAVLESARKQVSAEIEAMSAEERVSASGLLLIQRRDELAVLESMQTGGFEIADLARASSIPSSPQPVRNGLVAGVLGLLIGVVGAFGAEKMDTRIKDEDQLQEAIDLPIIANVPKAKLNGTKATMVAGPEFLAKNPAFVESYRVLRSNLKYFEVDGEFRIIAVTSALPEEGKSVTAANLAVSLAMSGSRVFLIEADLRKPKLHEYLGLEQGVGLSSVLSGRSTLMAASKVLSVKRAAEPDAGQGTAEPLEKDLYCLLSGPIPPNPSELLESERMRQVLQEAASISDFVLLDTPPLLLVADGISLVNLADAVIVSARLHKTRTSEAKRLRPILERARAKAVGVVATGAKAGPIYYRLG